MPEKEVRLGIAGLGKAFRMMLSSGIFNDAEGVRLTAGADLRAEERERFARRFGIETFGSVEEMCQHGPVDAVWVFTPHYAHAESAITAAEHGKHLLVEKPMCVTIDEANRMVDAVERNGVKYVHAHSKIYFPPMQMMARIIQSGRLGRVISVNSWYYNDWMCRPEWSIVDLDPNRGGGPLYWLGPHHMDIVRWLGGGLVRSVRASMGRWRPGFDIEGNYSAFLDFQDGATSMITLSTYGQFNSWEFTWNIGEGGNRHPDERLYGPRTKNPRPLTVEEKYALADYSDQALEDRVRAAGERRGKGLDFFGVTIVSCEWGDMRQSPHGLYLYTEDGREEIVVAPDLPPTGELVELAGAVLDDRPTLLDARWARASLEICTAILESSRERREVYTQYQVPSPVRPSQ